MVVNYIKIQNFRSVENEKFSFDANLNLFVGINGSGKTTVLDALTIALSWLVSNVINSESAGREISFSDIRNGASYASIEISVTYESKKFTWKVVKTAKGAKNIYRSNLSKATNLAGILQDQFKSRGSLPLFVYYPINRNVNADIPVVSDSNFGVIEAFEELTGKINYGHFFDWFRLQDDLINERVASRSKWMSKNKYWLKRKVKKIFVLLEYPRGKDLEHDERDLLRHFTRDDFIYEDPAYFFHEMLRLIHLVKFKFGYSYEVDRIFHGIEYLIHKMESFSRDSRDKAVDPDLFPYKNLEIIIHQLYELINDNTQDKGPIISLIWESLSLGILLSFWWIRDISREKIEHDLENYTPLKYSDSREWMDQISRFIISLRKRFKSEAVLIESRSFGARELNLISSAIEGFTPEYTNLRVARVPTPHILVDKYDTTLQLNQLSDGEKNLLVMVGDLARRLCIAYNENKEPLSQSGIILIDEIDLHLHPKWQRIVIPNLRRIFPNCQFFISTHSPQVVSHVMPNHIYLLINEGNTLRYSKAIESYGKNTDRILEDLLGVHARPAKEKERISKLFELISENRFKEAEVELTSLRNLIGDDPELVKAQVLIKRKEILGK